MCCHDAHAMQLILPYFIFYFWKRNVPLALCNIRFSWVSGNIHRKKQAIQTYLNFTCSIKISSPITQLHVSNSFSYPLVTWDVIVLVVVEWQVQEWVMFALCVEDNCKETMINIYTDRSNTNSLRLCILIEWC